MAVGAQGHGCGQRRDAEVGDGGRVVVGQHVVLRESEWRIRCGMKSGEWEACGIERCDGERGCDAAWVFIVLFCGGLPAERWD